MKKRINTQYKLLNGISDIKLVQNTNGYRGFSCKINNSTARHLLGYEVEQRASSNIINGIKIPIYPKKKILINIE